MYIPTWFHDSLFHDPFAILFLVVMQGYVFLFTDCNNVLFYVNASWNELAEVL